MPKRKEGFQLSSHREAAAQLKAIEVLAMRVADGYGVTSKQGKAAQRLSSSARTLRSSLDDAVFAENLEGESRDLATVYFGADERGTDKAK